MGDVIVAMLDGQEVVQLVERTGDPVGSVSQQVDGALAQLEAAPALVNHGDGQAGPAQPDRGQQARQACPDDYDVPHRATSAFSVPLAPAPTG